MWWRAVRLLCLQLARDGDHDRCGACCTCPLTDEEALDSMREVLHSTWRRTYRSKERKHKTWTVLQSLRWTSATSNSFSSAAGGGEYEPPPGGGQPRGCECIATQSRRTVRTINSDCLRLMISILRLFILLNSSGVHVRTNLLGTIRHQLQRWVVMYLFSLDFSIWCRSFSNSAVLVGVSE